MRKLEARVVRSRSSRVAGALLAVGLCLELAGCSSGTTPTIAGATGAQLTVTVDPNPIVAVQNVLTTAVTANFTINVKESNGVGCELQFLSASIFDPASGAQVGFSYYDAADLVVFVGSKRLDPLGSLTVPLSMSYGLASLGKAATLVVSVQAMDDRGNLINRSLLVPIQ